MAKWRCNFCGTEKGVLNGVCPSCGPSQTTPLDEEAKQAGGFYVAEEEKKKAAEAQAKAEVKPE